MVPLVTSATWSWPSVRRRSGRWRAVRVATARDVRYSSLCCRRSAAVHGRLPEWPKGTVCKTVGSAYDGSNPSPATTLRKRPASCEFSRLAGRSSLSRPIPRTAAGSGTSRRGGTYLPPSLMQIDPFGSPYPVAAEQAAQLRQPRPARAGTDAAVLHRRADKESAEPVEACHRRHGPDPRPRYKHNKGIATEWARPPPASPTGSPATSVGDQKLNRPTRRQSGADTDRARPAVHRMPARPRWLSALSQVSAMSEWRGRLFVLAAT